MRASATVSTLVWLEHVKLFYRRASCRLYLVLGCAEYFLHAHAVDRDDRPGEFGASPDGDKVEIGAIGEGAKLPDCASDPVISGASLEQCFHCHLNTSLVGGCNESKPASGVPTLTGQIATVVTS
jgi:hypothetical protein